MEALRGAARSPRHRQPPVGGHRNGGLRLEPTGGGREAPAVSLLIAPMGFAGMPKPKCPPALPPGPPPKEGWRFRQGTSKACENLRRQRSARSGVPLIQTGVHEGEQVVICPHRRAVARDPVVQPAPV